MAPSPAPKSLDLIDLNMKTSLAVSNNQQTLIGNGAVSSPQLPPSISAPIQLEPQHDHSVQVSKEIFNACKMGDLPKLKKYLTPGNVNIRDSSGGRSTVNCSII